MHSTPFFATAAIVACASAAHAAEPTNELNEALVDKIVNLQSRNSTPQLRVALILEGGSPAKGFETRHIRRVVTVHPVITDGRQVRKVVIYDFNWSPGYGWFLWEKRTEPGGESVWIWSELQGETIIR